MPPIQLQMDAAKAVIEDIQKGYSLHRDDVDFRRANPDSDKSKRQKAWIERFENMLDLYLLYLNSIDLKHFYATLQRSNALHS